MKVKNVNSASKKTSKRIKETFAELLQEKKDLNNITVTELVKKADITRSSFYTHFDSIYDVAQALQDETLEVLMTNLTGIETLEDFDNYFDIIFDYLEKNEKIYTMMLASNDPLLFANRLSKYFNNYILNALKKANHTDLVLYATFYTDGCMDLIIKYFRKEIDNSLDEIKNFMKDLLRKLFN